MLRVASGLLVLACAAARRLPFHRRALPSDLEIFHLGALVEHYRTNEGREALRTPQVLFLPLICKSMCLEVHTIMQLLSHHWPPECPRRQGLYHPLARTCFRLGQCHQQMLQRSLSWSTRTYRLRSPRLSTRRWCVEADGQWWLAKDAAHT